MQQSRVCDRAARGDAFAARAEKGVGVSRRGKMYISFLIGGGGLCSTTTRRRRDAATTPRQEGLRRREKEEEEEEEERGTNKGRRSDEKLYDGTGMGLGRDGCGGRWRRGTRELRIKL